MQPARKQVAGAIIQNEYGDFLLQQRGVGAPSFELCWTLFGGIMEDNETPEETVRRELIEELEFKPEHILSCELFVEQFQQNGTKQFIFHITTNATIDELVLHEGEQMQYVSRKELFNREFAFNTKEVLESFIYEHARNSSDKK